MAIKFFGRTINNVVFDNKKYKYTQVLHNGVTKVILSPLLNYTLSADESYYTVSPDRMALTGAIEIPETVNGIQVKWLSGFQNQKSLTKVTCIGGNAIVADYGFSDCQNLQEVEGVSAVGRYAFQNCKNLYSVSSPIIELKECSFYGCTALDNIIIDGDYVGYIPNNCFSGCSSLTTVYFIGSEDLWNTLMANKGTGNDVLDNIDPIIHTHSYGDEVVIKYPDCSTEGTKKQTCSCGAAKFSTIPALGHRYGEWGVHIDSTCATYGERRKYCECGLYETEIIPLKDHVWGDWYTTLEPTCTAEGVKEHSCVNCRLATESDIVEIIPHDMIAATCTVPSHCKHCDYTEGDVIPHTYTEKRTEATCTEDAYKTFTCACGDSYIVDEPGTRGHKWGEWNITLEPTCTEEGKEVCTCLGCNDKIENTLEKIPHDFTEWQYDPDINKDRRECTSCGKTETKSVDFGYVDLGNGTYGVRAGEDLSGDVEIPSEYKGRPVTAIQGGFTNNQNITSVKIPGSIEVIGEQYFAVCTSLTTVEIGEGVRRIESQAFLGCSSLTSVIVPDSVTSIGSMAFYECTGLTGVVIGKGVTSIGANAFENCSSLASVVIGDSVTSIFERTFYKCSNLTSVVIGDSVTSIGNYAFYGCSSLTEFVIPDSVTSIGDYVFYQCSSLKSVWLGAGITNMGKSPFSGCTMQDVYVTSVTAWLNMEISTASHVPNCRAYNLRLLDENGSDITALVIPDGITEIPSYRFYRANLISSVIIPKSVTSFGSHAFTECLALNTVYYEGTKAEWENNVTLAANNDWANTDTLYYYSESEPEDIGSYWRWVDGQPVAWCKHEIIVDEAKEPTCTEPGLTEGKHCSICGQVFVKQEKIPADHDYNVVVTAPTCTTGGYTTHTCDKCGDSYVTDEIAPIGHRYQSVITAPTCVTGGYTRYTCSNCGDSYIGDQKNAVGHIEVTDKTVAATCIKTGLTEGKHCSVCNTILVKQQTLPTIDHTCTEGVCTMCGKEVATPSKYFKFTSVTGGYSIAANTAETMPDEVVIPNTYNGKAVIQIAGQGFQKIASIKKVTIPPNITVIGNDAFYQCGNLEMVIIGDGVATIKEDAFGLCSKLKTAVIGKSVKSIETWAFYSCSKLAEVFYKGTEAEWNKISITANNYLTKAARYYYSETQPTTTGSHWHYVNGIPKLWCKTHTVVTDKAVAATCTTTGLTQGSHCSTCGMIIVKQEVVPFTHTLKTDAAVNPTCTEPGLTQGSHCTKCGEVMATQEVIPTIGHAYRVTIVPPTCTEAGYTKRTCSCGDSYNTDEVKAKGHKYRSIVKPPNCTENGYTTHTCAVCDHSYVGDEVAAEGHKYDAVLIIEPTCTEDGSKTYTCNVCGHSYVVTLPARGHMYESYVIQPTCTKPGSTYYRCLYDSSHSHGVEDTPALGHDYVDDVCTRCGHNYYTSNDYFTFELNANGTYSIRAKDVNNMPAELVIPKAYNGVAVTHIPHRAFLECKDIISVIIPDSVTYIGASAFGSCNSLTSIVIPDSVTYIEYYAFSGNKNLSNIVIGKGVVNLGAGAFQNCPSLTKVELPDSLTYINDSVFSDCTNLAEVVVGKNIQIIGRYAFSKCISLVDFIIPDTVTRIDPQAFSGCKNLTIQVSADNTTYRVEDGCVIESATGTVIFANKDASIPSTVSDIGAGSFNGAFYAPIKIPLSVTTIQAQAFTECEDLVIYVEASSKPEGWAADWHDGSIKVVWGYKEGSASCSHVYGEWNTIVTPTCTAQGVKERVCTICGKYEIEPIPTLGHLESKWWIIDKKATIYETGKKHKECALCGHTLKVETIPKLGYVVDDNLKFEWVNNWEYIVSAKDTDISGDIYIPSTYDGKPVTSVAWVGFSECHNITSVTIAEGVSIIEGNAFAGCTNLKKVIIPDTVKFIGEYAFFGCDNLECLVIGSGVEEIGDWAIPNNLNRNYIYYRSTPDDWMKIKSGDNNGLYVNTVYYYFNNTHPVGSLKYWHYVNGEIVIWEPSDNSFPEYLEATRYYDYYEVKAKEGATLPQILEIPATYNNVPIIRIADRGFRENLYLNEVRLPEGIREIGAGAFFGCDMLGYDLVIPASVELIESNAFGQCGGIRTITFANGDNDYSRIKNGAFSDCHGLQELNISSVVTNIEEGAFERCYGLESITVDEGNRKYYSYNNCIIERETNKLVLGCKGSVIPSSVTSIGSGAFYVTMHEAPIKIPLSVTTIKPLAFNGYEDIVVHCEASSKPAGWADDWCGDNVTVEWGIADPYEGFMLESIYDDDTEVRSYSVRAANEFISGDIIIPSHFYRAPVVQIAPWGFAGCKDITSVIIPYGIEHIGEYAFADCANLTKAVIFDTTDIDQYAFFGCDNLECLVIGSGVRSIASYALPAGISSDCIYYEGTAEEWARIEVSSVGNTVDTDAIYYYSDSEPTEEGNYWRWVDDEIVVWGTPDTYLVTESGEYLTDEQGNLLII